VDQEFRKPFEYEEEKRGLLLLFVIMILVIDILPTLSFMARFYEAFDDNRSLSTVLIAICAIFILYTVFIAVICFTLNKNLVAMSKLYLIIQAVFSATCYAILFFSIADYDNLIGIGTTQYESFGEMLSWELLFPLAYIAVFTAAWYLYFIKSKRCKELIKNKAGK
jgi:glucan phosphoethanolaminetransferase (alkaline phosphatase superfamily)